MEDIEKYEWLGRAIVSIDESGFAHDMPRTDGDSKIGERCFGTHDWGARKRTRDAGHILEYLPPYSPDLNPIEHKWAQAKSQRKKYQCGIDKLFKEYFL